MKKNLLFLFAIVLSAITIKAQTVNTASIQDDARLLKPFQMTYHLQPKKSIFTGKVETESVQRFLKFTTVNVTYLNKFTITTFSTESDTFCCYTFKDASLDFYTFRNKKILLKARGISEEVEKIRSQSQSDYKFLDKEQFEDVAAYQIQFKTNDTKKDCYVLTDKFPPVNGIFNLLYNNTKYSYYPIEFTMFVNSNTLVFTADPKVEYEVQETNVPEFETFEYKELSLIEMLKMLDIK